MTLHVLPYAGVGARITPAPIKARMTLVARQLFELGFTLRSGGAVGADEAFATGGGDRAKIYTPADVTPESDRIAKLYHPKWSKLSAKGRGLMSRDSFQVLGDDLNDPSLFVACWTPDGDIVGGTGQAIRIAKAYGIPVYNFADFADDVGLIGYAERIVRKR